MTITPTPPPAARCSRRHAARLPQPPDLPLPLRQRVRPAGPQPDRQPRRSTRSPSGPGPPVAAQDRRRRRRPHRGRACADRRARSQRPPWPAAPPATWRVPPGGAQQRRRGDRAASGFRADVLISWGDRVDSGRAALRRRHARRPRRRRKQFGYNNDYVGVLPHPTTATAALLVTNHEYTDEKLMFPDRRATTRATIKRIAMASHGMSVVEIAARRRARARGQRRRSARPRSTAASRRQSEFRLVGPAAGRRPAARPPRTRPAARCSARSTTAPAGSPRGARCSPARRTSTSTSTRPPAATSTRATPRRTTATASAASPSRGWDEVDPRFDLTPGAARAVPVRLDRRGRPVRPGLDAAQAHDARPVQARGRQRHDRRRRAASSPTWATTSAFDYIYKFVSAGTVRPRQQPARPGATTCACSPRARCTSPGSPATASRTSAYDGVRHLDPADQRHRVVRRRHVGRRRAHRHPARRRHGRRRPRWTVPRTSRSTRSTAGSTAR